MKIEEFSWISHDYEFVVPINDDEYEFALACIAMKMNLTFHEHPWIWIRKYTKNHMKTIHEIYVNKKLTYHEHPWIDIVSNKKVIWTSIPNYSVSNFRWQVTWIGFTMSNYICSRVRYSKLLVPFLVNPCWVLVAAVSK